MIRSHDSRDNVTETDSHFYPQESTELSFIFQNYLGSNRQMFHQQNFTWCQVRTKRWMYIPN